MHFNLVKECDLNRVILSARMSTGRFLQSSASQPFFNRGTFIWNRSPDDTLHLRHLFYVQDLHVHVGLYTLIHFK